MARKPASEQGDTLEDIRQAAFGLFGRYGYDGVSLSKVASAANITKAAIYWHYDDKTGLYLECLSLLYELIRGHVLQAMAEAATPSERILNLFEGVGRLLHDPRIRDGVAGYWLEAKTADLAAAQDIQQSFEEDARALICATLEQGIEAGEFDMMLPVEDMATAIISLVEASLLPLRRQTPQQTQRLLGSLAHTFFRANAHNADLIERAMHVAQPPEITRDHGESE